MKATLEFDLDNPDDKMSHFRCVKALDMALALHSLEGIIRDYQQEKRVKSELVLADFMGVLLEYGIVIEELMN